jgi:DNA-binding transcriptional ArsR family regulator
MPPDHLSTTLAALAHPARRGILARLANGDASVTELAEPYDMSLAAISKHLKVLEHAGLVSRARDAQWRPCRLEAKPLREVLAWVTDFQRFWESSLDGLDHYLQTLQQGRNPAKSNPRGARKKRQ